MSYDWPSKEADRPLFPLKTVGQVRALFESHLARPEPDLALLSIVAGFVENTLTAATSITTSESSDVGNGDDNCVDSDVTSVNLPLDPHVSWDTVDTLMTKFNATVRGFCDPELLSAVIKPASDVGDKKVERLSLRKRKLIKHIADIVWNTLTKSQYKDRPHLQSIYSYLTGNKLDCFGVAYAVVAALQLLEVSDVHLAVSEDHAWVVFEGDEEGEVETAEVTWHGKGTEDKRGQPVEPLKAKTSWLYVAGRPTLCDRAMEVAAMVSAINPAVNSGVDSMEVGAVQQELLWLLYDSGHLKKYPLAIGNLADLEEITPTIGRPNCSQLYEESVQSNTKHYSNHHVYPHTYQGGYFYRHKRYKKAIEAWANAATVMKLYNYSKEDEEIYKEFMEIANDFLPHIVKSQALPTDASSTTASQGAVSEENSSDPANGAATIPDTPTLLKDPEAFSNVLRFYDGLCSWEEGSATPILHIGWAKPMVATLSKFDPSVRQKVAGVTDDSSDEDEDDEDKDKKGNQSCSGMSPSLPPLVPKLSPEPSPVITSSPHPSLGHGGSPATNVSPISSMSAGSNSTMNMSCIDPECFQKIEDVSSTSAPSFQTPSSSRDVTSPNSSPHNQLKKSVPDQNGSDRTSSNYNKCDLSSSNVNQKCHESFNHQVIRENTNCDIDASHLNENVSLNKFTNRETMLSLGRECRTQLLSLPYLLGRSTKPFDKKSNPLEVYSRKPALSARRISRSQRPSLVSEAGLFVDCGLDNKNPFYAAEKAEKCPKKPSQKLKLTSDKMKGLRELLAAEKFNVGAIQLQVTAQSNTADDSIFSRPKRSRRE